MPGGYMRLVAGLLAALLVGCQAVGNEGQERPAGEWRALPLIQNGKVHPDWVHTGFGAFVVDEGALRTECDARGLGLLVYSKERLGDCQIRVVYKSKDARSNAGVYVRI